MVLTGKTEFIFLQIFLFSPQGLNFLVMRQQALQTLALAFAIISKEIFPLTDDLNKPRCVKI